MKWESQPGVWLANITAIHSSFLTAVNSYPVAQEHGVCTSVSGYDLILVFSSSPVYGTYT